MVCTPPFGHFQEEINRSRTVDGLDPLKGAKRMVDWLQQPLETQPPAFATMI